MKQIIINNIFLFSCLCIGLSVYFAEIIIMIMRIFTNPKDIMAYIVIAFTGICSLLIIADFLKLIKVDSHYKN